MGNKCKMKKKGNLYNFFLVYTNFSIYIMDNFYEKMRLFRKKKRNNNLYKIKL